MNELIEQIQARANDPFGTLKAGIGLVDEDRDYLLAVVREQQSRLDAVAKIADEKYRLWAAVCGNTCNKDIMGVDHDAIADEVANLLRAALTATEGS